MPNRVTASKQPPLFPLPLASAALPEVPATLGSCHHPMLDCSMFTRALFLFWVSCSAHTSSEWILTARPSPQTKKLNEAQRGHEHARAHACSSRKAPPSLLGRLPLFAPPCSPSCCARPRFCVFWFLRFSGFKSLAMFLSKSAPKRQQVRAFGPSQCVIIMQEA